MLMLNKPQIYSLDINDDDDNVPTTTIANGSNRYIPNLYETDRTDEQLTFLL